MKQLKTNAGEEDKKIFIVVLVVQQQEEQPQGARTMMHSHDGIQNELEQHYEETLFACVTP